jgi:hypothetical protein
MDSMGSMGSGFVPPTPGVGDMTSAYYDHEMTREEEIRQTEAVMVSVRYVQSQIYCTLYNLADFDSVRPPNPVEMQRDGESIWTTSPYEPQLLKLHKGTQVGRDDREWTYGTLELLILEVVC